MGIVNRIVGSTLAVEIDMTVPATATPTVQLFTDAGRTTLYGGPARVVTGSGSVWYFPISDLPVGTYYERLAANTAGGALTSDADTLVISPATITTVGSDVTTDDVADLLAQRVLTQDGNPGGTFSSLTVPTDAQVTRLIAKVAAEETGGLGQIPSTLTAMLHSLVALAAAVRVLSIYFSGDDARDDLEAELTSLRERFRQAVDVIATTGDENASSADAAGEAERPPPIAWSFPVMREEIPPLFGYRGSTLGEQF